ncbi:MAG TPA: hypothetical protein VHB23_09590 [Devosiaceae bacterium]|jgi:hypothetical protein|nr:hypothetical protein [Devosiaceae bacterium]
MRPSDIPGKLPGAGLGLGALAWGASTELNYALAPRQCLTPWPMIPIFALILALIAAAGIWVSVEAWRQHRPLPSPDRPEAGVPEKLLAGIGVLAGVLFAVIILLQGTAGFFLNGCE